MPGNVLALQVGPWQDLGDGVVSTGYRSILSVQEVIMDVQETTFFGQNLFMATYSPWGVGQVDVGSLTVYTVFSNFLRPYLCRETTWAQFADPPYNPSFYINRTYVLTPPAPEPPMSHGVMVLIGAAYDPLKGWWCRFRGNFRLAIPVFQNFPWVTDLTPDYGIKVK
jgi:hypothetical protein